MTVGIEFAVVVCPICELGHTTPYPDPDQLGLLYDESKLVEGVDMNARDFDAIRGNWIDRVKDHVARRNMSSRILRSLPHPPRSAVDFGAGNGRYASQLARACGSKLDVTAVDYQPDRPRALSDSVTYSPVSEFLSTDGAYDLIILRHVLEHAPEPVALLSSLAERLSSDGVIYVEIPNMDSGLAKLTGRRWTGYYVPRHLFHFNSRSFALAMENAGLRGEIRGCELPIMGNQLAELLGASEYGPAYQILGAALYPVQRAVEMVARSSGCLMSLCRLR